MQQVRSLPTQPLLSQQIPRKVCHSALVDCSKRQCFLFYQHYHTGGSGSFLSSSEIQDGAIVNQETLKYTLEDIESLREFCNHAVLFQNKGWKVRSTSHVAC